MALELKLKDSAETVQYALGLEDQGWWNFIVCSRNLSQLFTD